MITGLLMLWGGIQANLWMKLGFGGDELRQLYYSLADAGAHTGWLSREILIQPYSGQILGMYSQFILWGFNPKGYFLISVALKIWSAWRGYKLITTLKEDKYTAMMAAMGLIWLYTGSEGLMPVNSVSYLTLGWWWLGLENLVSGKAIKAVGWWFLSLIFLPVRMFGAVPIMMMTLVLAIIKKIITKKNFAAIILIFICGLGLAMKAGFFGGSGTAGTVNQQLTSGNYWRQIVAAPWKENILRHLTEGVNDVFSGRTIKLPWGVEIGLWVLMLMYGYQIYRAKPKLGIIILGSLAMWPAQLLIPSLLAQDGGIAITDRYLTIPAASLMLAVAIILNRKKPGGLRMIGSGIWVLILAININLSINYPLELARQGQSQATIMKFYETMNQKMWPVFRSRKRPIVLLESNDRYYVFRSIWDGEGRRFGLFNYHFQAEYYLPVIVISREELRRYWKDDPLNLHPDLEQFFGFKIQPDQIEDITPEIRNWLKSGSLI